MSGLLELKLKMELFCLNQTNVTVDTSTFIEEVLVAHQGRIETSSGILIAQIGKVDYWSEFLAFYSMSAFLIFILLIPTIRGLHYMLEQHLMERSRQLNKAKRFAELSRRIQRNRRTYSPPSTAGSNVTQMSTMAPIEVAVTATSKQLSIPGYVNDDIPGPSLRRRTNATVVVPAKPRDPLKLVHQVKPMVWYINQLKSLASRRPSSAPKARRKAARSDHGEAPQGEVRKRMFLKPFSYSRPRAPANRTLMVEETQYL